MCSTCSLYRLQLLLLRCVSRGSATELCAAVTSDQRTRPSVAVAALAAAATVMMLQWSLCESAAACAATRLELLLLGWLVRLDSMLPDLLLTILKMMSREDLGSGIHTTAKLVPLLKGSEQIAAVGIVVPSSSWPLPVSAR